jgi:hypothetical protein
MRATGPALTFVLLSGCLFAPLAARAQPASAVRPQEVTFEGGGLTPRGFIHGPAGSAPSPVVLCGAQIWAAEVLAFLRTSMGP